MTQFDYENAVHEIKCEMNKKIAAKRELVRIATDAIRAKKNEIRKLYDEIEELKDEMRDIEMEIHEIKNEDFEKIGALRAQYFRDNNINVE